MLLVHADISACNLPGQLPIAMPVTTNCSFLGVLSVGSVRHDTAISCHVPMAVYGYNNVLLWEHEYKRVMITEGVPAKSAVCLAHTAVLVVRSNGAVAYVGTCSQPAGQYSL